MLKHSNVMNRVKESKFDKHPNNEELYYVYVGKNNCNL